MLQVNFQLQQKLQYADFELLQQVVCFQASTHIRSYEHDVLFQIACVRIAAQLLVGGLLAGNWLHRVSRK